MKKTIVKTVGYRVLNGIYGFAIGMLATGKWEVAVAMVGTEMVYKMGVYFVYDRVWETNLLKNLFT